MTQFSAPTLQVPKLLRPTWDDDDQPTRAAAVDSLIAENRKLTPPDAANKRAVPRASIAELNAADIDALRERFAKTRIDNRGPVVRFLDMLDLPRNTIAGLLAPGIRRRKEAQGDTAALGQGRVYFSDILDDLGVENRVVRGVVGFIGDVALDPLTYAGPAGWGVKGASAAGRTGQLTKGFARAAKEAVEAAKVGREAADPMIRQYLAHAGAKTADEVGTALFGTGRTRLNKALRVVGADIEGKGSRLLTDALDDVIHPLTAPAEAERIRAAKALYDRYGRHNAPGLRIGRDAAGKLAVQAGKNPGTTIMAGTGLAHIPFTDISLSIPAVTNRARMGVAAGMLSRGVEASGVLDPEVKAIHDLTGVVNTKVAEAEGLRKRQAELDRLTDSGVVGISPERTAAALRMQEVVGELTAKDGPVAQLNARLRALESKPLSNPADLLYAQKVFAANDANARRIVADYQMGDVERIASRGRWDALMGEFSDEVNARVRKMGEEHEAIETAKWKASREPVDTDWPMKPLLHTKAPFDEAAARKQATATLRGEYRARLQPDDQAIFDMSPQSMEAADKLSDALHAKMAANIDLATATAGTLDATLSTKDRALMDAAKMVMGLSPDDLGHTMFAPLRDVARSIAEDREGVVAMLAKGAGARLANTDAKARTLFGRHSGKTHDLIRDYLRATSPASNPMVDWTLKEIGRDLKEIVGNPAHNIRPQDQPEFERLLGNLIDAVALEGLPSGGDEVYRIIDEARAAGLFSEAAHPGLYAAARQFADKWQGLIREMGQTEVAAGQLGKLKEGYGLPSMVSRETSTRIAGQKQFATGLRGQEAGAGANVGKLVEAFQKPRSTDLYRWTDANGNAREFMQAERVYADIREETLRRMDPEAANHIRAIQQTIKEFDALPPSKQPKPVPVSRAQVNKWVKEDGRFRWLTGGDLSGDFFETAVSHAIASRFGSSYKSYLHGRLMDWATQYARPLDSAKIDTVWQSSGDGATFRFDNGATGKLYKGPKGEPYLVVGDQRFRKLRDVELEAGIHNPSAAITRDPKAVGLWFPEEVADLIERANVPFRDESTVEAIIKGADEINKLWKMVTLTHPSWTIGDIVGSLYLAAFGGLNVPNMVKRSRDAMRIVTAMGRKDEAALSRLELNVGGRTITGLDVARAEGGAALFGAGNAYEAIMHMLANGHLVPMQTWKLWKNPGKAIGEEWDRAAKFAEAEMHGREWGKAKAAGTKAAQVKAFLKEGVARRLWAPWFQLNGQVNDVIRVSAYLSLLDAGYDATQAARKVGDTLFDMTTLTATEQSLRRWFPFYSWAKNSGVYGIRQLMENPKFFTIAPKVKHALEEAANGEENLPEHQRPTWMRDQQAALFGKGDTRKAIMLGTLLPQEAAAYMATGLGSPILGAQALQDAVSYFGNQLSPLVKVPLELASHREWFTKREISGDGTGDLTVGEYLGGQIRPLKELGLTGVRRSPLATAFERSPTEGVARVLLGGRAQPAGDERLGFNLQREHDDRDKALRKRINLAEREGQPAESLDKRVEQLLQYRDAARRGLRIPRWAETQLREIGALSGA